MLKTPHSSVVTDARLETEASTPRLGCTVMLTALLIVLSTVQLRAQNFALSPREQLQQYANQLQKNPSDDALREKIIKLGLTLEPKPNTPPKVQELLGRGGQAFEDAKKAISVGNTSDANRELAVAVDSFAQASLLAPWVANYYLNLASAFDATKDYTKALKNYEFYLEASPDAQDADTVRQRVGALKYEMEKQQAADAAVQAQRQAELDAERARERAAEQAREQAQREDQQRLANLDPMVRSLDGAVYQSRSDRRGRIFMWTIGSYRITESARLIDGTTTNASYLIEGRQFYIPWTNTNPNDSCWRFYSTNNCGWRGTIGQNVISFEFVADGKPQSTEMGTVGGDAKRVR
jgi:tetratricopeptide (TPR) repeat protein